MTRSHRCANACRTEAARVYSDRDLAGHLITRERLGMVEGFCEHWPIGSFAALDLLVWRQRMFSVALF
jgi:hypothetical protein